MTDIREIRIDRLGQYNPADIQALDGLTFDDVVFPPDPRGGVVHVTVVKTSEGKIVNNMTDLSDGMPAIHP